MGWVAFGVVCLLVIGIATAIAQSKRRDALADTLESVPGFAVSQHFIEQNGGHGIAIDEAAGLVCFIRSIGGTSAHTVVAAKDILSSEVFEDGETVTRS